MSYLVGWVPASGGWRTPGGLGGWQEDVDARWVGLRQLILLAIASAPETEGVKQSYLAALSHLDSAKDKVLRGEVSADDFFKKSGLIYQCISRPETSNTKLLFDQFVEMIQNAPEDISRLAGRSARAAAEGAGLNLGLVVPLALGVIGVVGLVRLLGR